MKKPNITPGKWATDRAGVNVIDPKEKEKYVLCHCRENTLSRLCANAQAIAAVPKLLEVLERINTWLVCPDTSKEALAITANEVRAALLAAGYTE